MRYQIPLLCWFVLIGIPVLMISGCSVELGKELVTFCQAQAFGNCEKHARFAGPDWNNEPFVYLDSATGLADTVLITGRSLYSELQKARIPAVFPKQKYTDKYVERFFFQATGFRLAGGNFMFYGDAESGMVTAAWGSYSQSELLRRALVYVEDSVEGRPVRDEFQLYANPDITSTEPRVLSAEFISTLGLYKLRVGPYDGKTYTFIRQNLLY